MPFDFTTALENFPKLNSQQLFWVRWVICFILIWPMALIGGTVQDLLSGFVVGLGFAEIQDLLYMPQDR
jgi:hypothetical protein